MTVRRTLAALVFGALVCLAPVAAAAVEPPPQDCDHLAAAPADGFGRGVPFAELNAEKAVASCREAAEKFPLSLRIKAHYGRALIKADEFRLARSVLEDAAQAGHPAAQSTLGAVYYFAIGVKRNYRVARQWFEESAEQNNAVALTNLGVMYTFGHGVRRDINKAAEYFERAATLNHPDALTNLGNIYEQGKSVKQDYRKAAEFYLRAAKQGNAKAQLNLAQLHEDGSIIGASVEQAYFWYSIASIRGDGAIKRTAKRGQRRSKNLLNADEVKAINREISTWEPADPV